MKVGTPKLKLLPGYSTTQTTVGARKSGKPTQWKTNAWLQYHCSVMGKIEYFFLKLQCRYFCTCLLVIK